MGITEITDERLRTYLAGKQPDQERLCAHVLNQDPRWTGVKPIRPKGSPDGGYDLEGTVDFWHRGLGAVGWKNPANDTPSQRSKIKSKFKSDIQKAKNAYPEMHYFAFMTNVDLTPDNKLKFTQIANDLGIDNLFLYAREDILHRLNEPAGFAARLQYLDIQMTKEEQLSFFSSFYAGLETSIESGFNRASTQLSRIEFLHARLRPAKYLIALIHLDKSRSCEEIGHFRIEIDIAKGAPVQAMFGGILPRAGIRIQAREMSGKLIHSTNGVNTEIPAFCFENKIINRLDPKIELARHFAPPTSTHAKCISLGVNLQELDIFSTLNDFDGVCVRYFITENLLPIERIELIVNNYQIIRADGSKLYSGKWWPDNFSPSQFTDDEMMKKWMCLSPIAPPIPWGFTSIGPDPFFLDFDLYTPPRIR